jgi:MSHA biogenesis protein MshI
VHVGSDRLTAAVVTGTAGGKPRVQACASFDGEHATPQMLHWHKALPRGRRGKASLLLEAHDYQLMVLDVPPVALEERREAIRWRLRDLIDFPAEEVALDCIEIPATHPGEQANKLLTVVSKRGVVGQWMQRFQDDGQPLVAIDVPELALRNVSLLAGQDSAHAYLHVGLETTRLLMIWQRELCAFRQLDVNASQWANGEDMDRADLAERLALEIQRSADAFARQYNAADFTNLWVSGAVDVVGLCDALTPLVTVPIKPLVLDQWIEWDGGGEQQVLDLGRRIDYTLAIGAALRVEAEA